MKTVKINPDKWLRNTEQVRRELSFGAYDYRAYLFDSWSEKMCCLGFLCTQSGLSERRIEDRGDPQNLAMRDYRTLLDNLDVEIGLDELALRAFFVHAIKINDRRDDDLSDQERVEELNEAAERRGIDIRFELE